MTAIIVHMITTSVIFPARNEENIIKSSVDEVYDYLKKKKYAFEILVVVNGCSDKTEAIVKAIARRRKEVKLLKTQPGYGIALKKGLKKAKGKFITVFNVDYYNLRLLDLADIEMYGKDIIIGSKRTYWAKDNRSFARRFISLVFNQFLNIVFGFRGSDTHGIKILKKEVVKKILPRCQTESDIFYTELIIKAQRAGFEIADFPVNVTELRPTRFTFADRVLKTPMNIYLLYRALLSR